MGRTAERLMDLAEARIRELGYGDFSVRDLAAEIGDQERECRTPGPLTA